MMIWLLVLVASLVNCHEPFEKGYKQLGHEVQRKVKTDLEKDMKPFHPLINSDFCIGKQDGNYPSSQCGNKFFSCSAGLTTVQHCPGALVYDPFLERCEVPSQSPFCTRGRVRLTPPTSTAPTAAPKKKIHFSCRRKKDGLYVDRRHPCRPFYYSCSNGEPTVMHCPGGLYFDPEMKMCDRYFNIPICTGRPRPATKKPEPTRKPAKMEPVNFNCRGKPSGNYPDPHSQRPYCSGVYYTCSNGLAILRRCPASLFYDPQYDVCDRFQNIYACTGRRRERTHPPKTTMQPTMAPVPFECRRKPDGYYVNPRAHCSAVYYACTGGIARQMKCQFGLAFDPETNSCQQPSVLRICGGRPLPKTKAPSYIRYVTRPPPIDCSHRPNGLYPDPLHRCSRIFYSCSNGMAIKMQCPAGMAYDYKSRSCQLASDMYICTGRHTTTMRPTRPPPTLPPVSFDCSRRMDGLYPNPKGLCAPFYYVCSNGIARKLQCPMGLFYDPHEQVCDEYNSIYVCTGRRKSKVPAVAQRSYARPSKEFDCRGRPSGLYPERKCSNVFFQCANDIAYKMECGHGLFFDPQYMRCDRFQNIYACTGRMQPVYKPKKSVKPAFRPIDYRIPVDCIQLGDGDHPEPGVLYGRSYYTCFNGQGVKRQCPKGTFFHVLLKRCESADSLRARRLAAAAAAVSYPGKTGRSRHGPCSDRPDGHYATGRCSPEFMTCVGGVATERHCPDGLYFDAERSTCDSRQHISSCGAGHRQSSQMDCSSRPDGPYPLSACHNVYLKCDQGKGELRRCPEHMVFNEKRRYCDYSYRTPSCAKMMKAESLDNDERE